MAGNSQSGSAAEAADQLSSQQSAMLAFAGPHSVVVAISEPLAEPPASQHPVHHDTPLEPQALLSGPIDEQALFLAKKSPAELKALKGGVKEFYANQNKLIDFYELAASTRAGASPSNQPPSGDAHRVARLVAWAINLSFAANLLCLAIKVLAVSYSGSLSVIASTVDSVMDLVSGAVVWFSAWLAARRHPYLFPVGKSRYEPLSIIVFAALMGAASLQLISQGATSLVDGFTREAPSTTTDARTWGVLIAIIVIKLALYFYCSYLKQYSSSVGALALDHYADIVTNSAPLCAVLLASYYPIVWWLDPLAAILMSVYMIWMWCGAARGQIRLIAGHAASSHEVSEITYLALTHDREIVAVDTVMAYTLGNKLQAEVDIVLPDAMSLRNTHDIGESLQKKIEQLANVERCFVHADYSWRDHKKDDEHYNPYDRRHDDHRLRSPRCHIKRDSRFH